MSDQEHGSIVWCPQIGPHALCYSINAQAGRHLAILANWTGKSKILSLSRPPDLPWLAKDER